MSEVSGSTKPATNTGPPSGSGEGDQGTPLQPPDTLPADQGGQPLQTGPEALPSTHQGDQLEWNFEDKNPFSEFSEEHLSKLDEVLSSAGVRELLQQSTSDLNLLNMSLDGTEQQLQGAGVLTQGTGDHGALGPGRGDIQMGTVGAGDGAIASTSHDNGDSLPESIISAVFSDHGYAINPEREVKGKAASSFSVVRPKPIVVTLDSDGSVLPMLGMDSSTSLLNKPSDQVPMDFDLIDSKSDSDYSSSPRKSGRAPTRNRYLDADWVMARPYKARGLAGGVTSSDVSPVIPFGQRASSRISDHKQRELAEKILLANRQAMEAERLGGDSSVGVDTQEESPVKLSPKGRGRPTKQDATTTDDQSTQEGSESEEESEEEEEEDKESSESEPETKKKEKKKKSGKYEQDSDYSDSDSKKSKKKKKGKGKTKGKKGDVEEESDGESEKKGKKGKKKKLEMKSKKKGKLKGKKLKKKGKEKKGKEKETQSDESEDEVTDKEKDKQKSPKGGKTVKKLSKKERLKKLKEAKEAKKAELLKKKKDKSKDKKGKKKKKKVAETEMETSDVSPQKKKKKGVADEVETPTSSPQKKKGKFAKESPKKIAKAESRKGASPVRASKRKGGEEPTKVVTTPVKKQKLEKTTTTGKKQTKQQMADIYSDSEDDVPLKKIKSDLENSPQKSSQSTSIDTSETKSVVKTVESTKSEQNIFSNLALTLTPDLADSSASISAGAKTDTIKEPAVTSDQQESKSLKAVNDAKSEEIVKDNLIGSETKVTETDLVSETGIKTRDTNNIEESVKDKVHDTNKSEKDTLKSEIDATDNVDKSKVIHTKETNAISTENNDKEIAAKDVAKESEKDSKDSHARRDSKDSKHSHHHHHHKRHSSDKRESVSEDSKNSSHSRRESHDSRKDSSSSHRRDSHDRKESHSRDKDRRSSSSHSKDKRDKERDRNRHDRKESDSKSKDRRDSDKNHERRHSVKDNDQKSDNVKDRRESVGSVTSNNSDKTGKIIGNTGIKKIGKDGKIAGKDAKIKAKKTKKEEMPMDASMIDLFKPDNLPAVPTIEINDKLDNDKQENVVIKDSKVKFKEDTETKPKTEISNGKDRESTDKKEVNIEELPDLVPSIENDKVVKENVKVEESPSKTPVVAATKSEIQETKNEIKTETEPKVKEFDYEEWKRLQGLTENSSEKTDTKDKLNEKKETTADKTVVKDTETPKEKKKLNMSDFFREKRLKINDPKPRYKPVKEQVSEVSTDTSDANSPLKRSKRNKAVAFAEILKKEKLGSDDEEEEEDPDYEDDKNDEDFEDPDKLYCICRQPHNQRFMICCDSCEEWFHGKCVGITRARGGEMEENKEEYICPQCSDKDGEKEGKVDTEQDMAVDDTVVDGADDKVVVSSTETMLDGSLTRSKLQDNTTSSELSVATTEVKSDVPDSTDEKTVTSSVRTPPKNQSDDKSKLATPTSTKTTPTISGEATPVKSSTKSAGKQQLGQIRKKSEVESISEKRKRTIKMFNEEGSPARDKSGKIQSKCTLCKLHPVKPGTKFCSSECEARQVKESLKPSSILKVTSFKSIKPKKSNEKHVAVLERSTGKTLTGDKAPTESELKQWLEEHPTYEILKAHNKPGTKPISSTSSEKHSGDKSSKHSSSSSTKSKRDDRVSSKDKSHDGPEPIRLNVRKGLRDALAARADAADDMIMSNSEIKSLSLKIEEELYRHFKSTDTKYKAKYRSLIFNIKDPKNNGLFRKILNRRIRSYKLVRMSADELASKELAQWREQETKHTIEMIKQVETEAQKEPIHVTKKTHKGEIEVEGEGGLDMSTLVDEVKKDVVKIDTKADLLADLLPDSTDKHGQHLFDASCKICTGKIMPNMDTTATKTGQVKTEHTPALAPDDEKEDKPLTKQERDLQAEEVVKEVLKAIQRAKADAKKEELESQIRSSVTVRSPDSALSSGLDKKVKFTPSGPQVWKGFLYMQDVSKCVSTAYRVTGPVDSLHLPDTITVCGRINPEHVWDYLNKVKQAASRDICVIRFIPGANEEKVAYINLYSYLNSRSRCGVVENKSKHIKDFYIVPLASHSKIPSVLKPFDGPGLEENRCHMLLGVIIRNKVKGSNSQSSSSSEAKSSSSSSSKSSLSKSSHHHGKSSSKSLKSALKDPRKAMNKKQKDGDITGLDNLGDTPDKSSSSSSPKTSSSSSTPQEKKKSISFDPIIKEYSNVSEQEDAFEPGMDDPNDLNAPYDPEREDMKPAVPKKGKSEAVSKMMEKIALSKNPAEATAAMVAALATTTKLGNQRKLLMELTKKVDEQKRLLEQKRISSKSAASNSVSSTSATAVRLSSKDPRLKSTTNTSGLTDISGVGDPVTGELMDVDMRIKPPIIPGVVNPIGASVNVSIIPQQTDPRLKTKTPIATVPLNSESNSATKSNPYSDSLFSNSSNVASMSVLQTSDVSGTSAGNVSGNSNTTETLAQTEKSIIQGESKSQDNSSTEQPQVKPFSMLIKPKSSVVTPIKKITGFETVDYKKMTSPNSVTFVKPKGFYVDQPEAPVTPVSKARVDVSSKFDLTKLVVVNVNEKDKTVKADQVKKVPIEQKTEQSILDRQHSSDVKIETPDRVKENKDLLKADSSVKITTPKNVDNVTTDSAVEVISEIETAAPDYDVLSHLQAEVGGSAVFNTEDKTVSDSFDSSSKPAVHDVTALLKGLVNPSNSPAKGGAGGLQLPSALMSLFSKLPATDAKETGPTSETVKGSKTDKNVSEVKTTELTNTDLEVDTDMRDQKSTKAKTIVPDSSVQLSAAEDESEKLSKCFMGFDYDSDSSGGSFDGFDDDGTKKLSPRKKKHVERSPSHSASGAPPNVQLKITKEFLEAFGDTDTDIREPASEDVDFRQLSENVDNADKDMRSGQPPPIDVDERVRIPPGVVVPPPQLVLDVDHRRPSFTNPQGMGQPLVAPNQPPPPGEEWDHPPHPVLPPGIQPGMSQPGPMSLPPHMAHLSQLPPISVAPDWAPTLPQPPALPSPPPLPSEPPAPKPPEPPTKGQKSAEDNGEGKSKKKKKKGGLLTSDERLQQIVLQIARKEPIQPPPLPPLNRGPRGPPQMPYNSGPPPMMPMQHHMPPGSMPPQMPPGSMPPHMPMTTQSIMTLEPPQHHGMPTLTPMNTTSGWGAGPPISQAMGQNSLAQMPPHVPPMHSEFGPPLVRPQRPNMAVLKPSLLGPGPSAGPPSLLSLPDLLPPPKLLAKEAATLAAASESPNSRMSDNSLDHDDVPQVPKGQGHEMQNIQGHEMQPTIQGQGHEAKVKGDSEFGFDDLEEDFPLYPPELQPEPSSSRGHHMSHGHRGRDREDKGRSHDDRRRRDRHGDHRSHDRDRSRDRSPRDRSRSRDRERSHGHGSHDRSRSHERDDRHRGERSKGHRDRDRGRNSDRDRDRRHHKSSRR